MRMKKTQVLVMKVGVKNQEKKMICFEPSFPSGVGKAYF